jgi:hypothetical protein
VSDIVHARKKYGSRKAKLALNSSFFGSSILSREYSRIGEETCVLAVERLATDWEREEDVFGVNMVRAGENPDLHARRDFMDRCFPK